VTISGPTLCTREDVKGALDSKDTARSNDQIDRAIEAATTSIEGLVHRRFFPELGTRTFDWPNAQHAVPWRLWLDANEVVSVTSLVAGGVTVSSADYFLRPDTGPPYTHIEIDLAGSAAFAGGATHQRAVAITGVFSHSADEAAAGATAEALDSSETGVDVTDSAAIGVGSIVRVDSERMVVTGKTMLTTGQTVQTPLTASASNTTVAVTTGTAFSVDEVILLDSERMLIVDIAGNNLTVKRAWDGSVLATHSGSTIYAPRTLTVTRGALGTTAASHLTAAPIVRHVVPAGIRQLAVAEALASVLQEQAGMARVVGSGDRAMEASGKGLADLRDVVRTRYGRKARIRST
jgi:hypothetical protein